MPSSVDMYIQHHTGKPTGHKIFGNNTIYKIEVPGKGPLYYYTRQWKNKKEMDDFGVKGKSSKRHVPVTAEKLFGDRLKKK